MIIRLYNFEKFNLFIINKLLIKYINLLLYFKN